jgi:syntaxin-binding protein 5
LQDAAAAAAHAKDKLMQRQEKLEVTVASRLQLISLVFFASPYSEQYQTCNYVCLFFFYQRISQQTAELQNGAENFASLAQELAKTMENKKWWKL